MLNKDQFEQFFSDSFANQTESVRPDLWSGVQAKMTASGVTSTVAAKSVSILTKWILGSIAVGSAATISALVLFNNNEDVKKDDFVISPFKNSEYKIEQSVNSNSTSQEISTKTKNNVKEENTIFETSVPSLIGSAIHSIENVVNDEQIVETKKENKIIDENKHVEDVVVENRHENITSENATNPNAVDVVQATEIRAKEINLVLPNVFTPNNDGQNDYYEIKSSEGLETLTNFYVQIMNQNNNIVFESRDLNFKWDGRYKDELEKQGVFVCIVTAIDSSGKKFKKIQLFEFQ